MKSGPTLNGAMTRPALRSAPISPVATVVLPLPEAGAAMTIAGVLIGAFARVRLLGCGDGASPADTHARRRGVGSPFDSALALAARVHRVLDACHLGHQVGRVEQALRGVAPGDHDVLVAWSGNEDLDHLFDV